MSRRTTSDLPEHYPYRDTGCNVAPACLNCPLPRCKYDDPEEYRRAQWEQRYQQILEVQKSSSKSPAMLAKHFGVSERTIYRALVNIREAGDA